MKGFNRIFLFEQGNGGVIQFPKEFLKKAYQLVRMNGGVCIADEVSVFSVTFIDDENTFIGTNQLYYRLCRLPTFIC